MPKTAITIISIVFSLLIGFLVGAFLTVPQNKEMEQLVNAKSEMTQQIKSLNAEKEELHKENGKLKKQVVVFKDRLLQAYQVEQTAEIN